MGLTRSWGLLNLTILTFFADSKLAKYLSESADAVVCRSGEGFLSSYIYSNFQRQFVLTRKVKSCFEKWLFKSLNDVHNYKVCMSGPFSFLIFSSEAAKLFSWRLVEHLLHHLKDAINFLFWYAAMKTTSPLSEDAERGWRQRGLLLLLWHWRQHSTLSSTVKATTCPDSVSVWSPSGADLSLCLGVKTVIYTTSIKHYSIKQPFQFQL